MYKNKLNIIINYLLYNVIFIVKESQRLQFSFVYLKLVNPFQANH